VTNERFLSFVEAVRRRHQKRFYTASLVGALIALLLYQTEWLYLRFGLVVLLVGQAGNVLALLVRNYQLARDVKQKNSGIVNWFEREEFFVTYLAIFDSACQMVGFLGLGYAFWISTRNAWIALAIGVVYPATVYLGITRRRHVGETSELRAKKQELQSPGGFRS
jgi:hypothetical protein